MNDLKQRTKQFAVRVIKLTENLPNGRVGDVLGRQLLRSGTSVAANYRSACRARSAADFQSKMGIVEEEADESALWLELVTESGQMPAEKTAALLAEANELTAIAVASIRTSRTNSRTKKN